MNTFFEEDREFFIDTMRECEFQRARAENLSLRLVAQDEFIRRAMIVLRLAAKDNWHAKNFVEKYGHATQAQGSSGNHQANPEASLARLQGIVNGLAHQRLSERHAPDTLGGLDKSHSECELPLQPDPRFGAGAKGNG